MELTIDQISKKYKDKEAVSQVSLKLTPGVWGLLGANGAGKTTLMRMVAGILKPTEGKVLYDGISIQVLGRNTGISSVTCLRSLDFILNLRFRIILSIWQC